VPSRRGQASCSSRTRFAATLRLLCSAPAPAWSTHRENSRPSAFRRVPILSTRSTTSSNVSDGRVRSIAARPHRHRFRNQRAVRGILGTSQRASRLPRRRSRRTRRSRVARRFAIGPPAARLGDASPGAQRSLRVRLPSGNVPPVVLFGGCPPPPVRCRSPPRSLPLSCSPDRMMSALNHWRQRGQSRDPHRCIGWMKAGFEPALIAPRGGLLAQLGGASAFEAEGSRLLSSTTEGPPVTVLGPQNRSLLPESTRRRQR
jgi:hypothetical protein